MPDVSLRAQLACARRELALRVCLYPRLVAHGQLRSRTAIRELAQQRAIVKTLQALIEADGTGETAQAELFAQTAEEP
jgi:hypothetical protein